MIVRVASARAPYWQDFGQGADMRVLVNGQHSTGIGTDKRRGTRRLGISPPQAEIFWDFELRNTQIL